MESLVHFRLSYDTFRLSLEGLRADFLLLLLHLLSIIIDRNDVIHIGLVTDNRVAMCLHWWQILVTPSGESSGLSESVADRVISIKHV